MSKIVEVHAREVLDSRGNPTIEADVLTDTGASGSACAPSGASTGSREAVELRDGDKDRYLGKGVLKAVGNVNGEIRSALLGVDGQDQARVDQVLRELDGTENKGRLGANATLAVSLADVAPATRASPPPLLHSILANPAPIPSLTPVSPPFLIYSAYLTPSPLLFPIPPRKKLTDTRERV